MSGPTEQEREALARILDDHADRYDSDCGEYFGCACGWDEDVFNVNAHQADAILAAGFRRPTPPGEATSVVTSIEELEALPRNTAVKSFVGDLMYSRSLAFMVGVGEMPEGQAFPATVLTSAPAQVDREALVERVAAAMYEVPLDGDIGSPWPPKHPGDAENMRVMARAALDAIEGVRNDA